MKRSCNNARARLQTEDVSIIKKGPRQRGPSPFLDQNLVTRFDAPPRPPPTNHSKSPKITVQTTLRKQKRGKAIPPSPFRYVWVYVNTGYALPLNMVDIMPRVQREDVGLVRVVLIVRVERSYPQQNFVAFGDVADYNRLACHRVDAVEH